MRAETRLTHDGGVVYSLYIPCDTMMTIIRKWGNSLGVRIPKRFAQEVGIEDGTPVDISVTDGHLVIRSVRRHRYRLGELLAGVRKDNIHGEIPAGRPVGRESW